jgi:hypothetical protein
MLEEHLGYVADRIRLEPFQAAIAKVIKAGDRVADLGCGRDPGTVYSIVPAGLEGSSAFRSFGYALGNFRGKNGKRGQVQLSPAKMPMQ